MLSTVYVRAIELRLIRVFPVPAQTPDVGLLVSALTLGSTYMVFIRGCGTRGCSCMAYRYHKNVFQTQSLSMHQDNVLNFIKKLHIFLAFALN